MPSSGYVSRQSVVILASSRLASQERQAWDNSEKRRPCCTGKFLPVSYMMREMFLRGSSLRRSGATALPFCLMWAFVACLALCSDQGKDGHEDYPHRSAQSTTESQHGDDCPIPAASFVLPEQQSYSLTPEMSVVGHSIFAASPLPSSDASQSLPLQSRYHSTSDPPLERLGILRI